MDGMNYHRNFNDTRARQGRIKTALLVAVVLLCGVGASLALHALNWTPPAGIELMGP